VYDAIDGIDGYVSLVVSPYLAHDTGGTMQEVRRLWHAVDRPNLELEEAGHPVVRITMPGATDLGAECFRWEVAAATAGAVVGVNPF
jgi:transaldolase